MKDVRVGGYDLDRERAKNIARYGQCRFSGCKEAAKPGYDGFCGVHYWQNEMDKNPLPATEVTNEELEQDTTYSPDQHEFDAGERYGG